MSQYSRVIEKLKERRERILSGKYNCIPLPFKRFRKIFPGIEGGKYIVVTANQKVGKSKLCDFLFIYDPLFYMMDHEDLKVKVLYFTLEISPDEKYNEFLCFLLWKLDNLLVSTTQLKSTDNENPISQEVLDLLDTPKYQQYIERYEEMVTFIDDIKNPTGINKYCREFAKARGTFNQIPVDVVDKETGEITQIMKLDPLNPYTPEDDTIVIALIDNASNLTLESGMKKNETIDKMSKYCITLRNQLKITTVLVQHQALCLHNSNIILIFVLY